MKTNIQRISRDQLNKYEEIIKYLNQDNRYWIDNDKWDITQEFFLNEKTHNTRYIDFSRFKNILLRNEIKYYILYNFKEHKLSNRYITSLTAQFKLLSEFVNKYYFSINSLSEVVYKKFYDKWKIYLLDKNIKIIHNGNKNSNVFNILFVIKFITKFYDTREETEKDIWYARNIKGSIISATQSSRANRLNFTVIPQYYRETVKRYFKTIITKKSFSSNCDTLAFLKYFFDSFYSRGYIDGFMENLNREDIEKYILQLTNDRKEKNKKRTVLYITYIKRFLQYIQIAEYKQAPKKSIEFLIFQDDIPKTGTQKYKITPRFIPEPIIKQIDSNIKYLSKSEYIPVYILLRETGWRGTDILNLRYHNCLEQIWNNKEGKYNYYLCGEITKTSIAQLKIPIRDKVAEMVQKAVDKAKELSTEDNNPKKYLFNTYKGKQKGFPLSAFNLRIEIKRLIKEKDIRDADGNLYHFRLHSLRHTRAKEYIEQGIGISIIQQILGHTSLQMTVHYATVSENTLYEKWKATEDLDLFKLNVETDNLERIDLKSDDGENLIRYEYVKKNLDAVKVPFGICFKPSKVPCKQQMNFCLTCASFCTTTKNIPEFEEEIERVKKQIQISNRCGRKLWVEKNKQYLDVLEKTLERVKEQNIIHKNSKSREES